MLFDTEPAPYQVKQEENEPTVKKFKVPSATKDRNNLPKATQEMIEKKKSVLCSLDTMIEEGAKEKRNTKYFE